MKKVLVYGDSNTWGDNLVTKKRIPDNKQWCNILQELLGNDYKIYQEGLPGRVAGSLNNINKYVNGKDSFISIYKSCAPIDILIISLGSNDLKPEYKRTKDDIINDLLWYKNILEEEFKTDQNRYFNGKMPNIIYLLPVNFKIYAPKYEKLILEKEKVRKDIINFFNDNNIDNIYFNDIGLFEDGIHINYEGHKKVAHKVFEKLSKLNEL